MRRPLVTLAAIAIAAVLLSSCGQAPAPGAGGSEDGSSTGQQGPIDTGTNPAGDVQIGPEMYPDGHAIELERDHFFWDADGDGTDEEFFVSFNDNGDEAPSGIGLSARTADGTEVAGYIDGAYELLDLWAARDGGMPVLVVTYYEGDFYSHDNIDVCILSLDGDTLEAGRIVILDGPYGEA